MPSRPESAAAARISGRRGPLAGRRSRPRARGFSRRRTVARLRTFRVQSGKRSSLLRLIFRAIFRRTPAKPSRPPTQRRAHDAYSPPSSPWQPTSRSSSPSRECTPEPAPSHPSTLTGKCYVIDGDTIQIGNVRLRLAGIDAPELDHPWGKKAKWELVRLCKGQTITARLEPSISYDRVVATCFLPDGRDLSAEMVQRGLALDWTRFSGGKYAHLEPEDARKKHWKAAARQRGHMQVFHK